MTRSLFFVPFALLLVGGVPAAAASPAGSNSPPPSATSANAPPVPSSSAAAPAAKDKDGVHYVYLVRHGHYDRDPKVEDDRKGNGLNPLGHEQARRTGERLASLPVRFDRLVSSEFLRAAETADDLARALKLTPSRDPLLNECTSTSTKASVMADESPEELAACDAARAAAWERWFRPTPERDTFDLLVCHGNVIRWILYRAIGADPTGWASADIAHASITIVAVRADGSVRLVAFSDAGHLPPAKQTWAGRGGGWGRK